MGRELFLINLCHLLEAFVAEAEHCVHGRAVCLRECPGRWRPRRTISTSSSSYSTHSDIRYMLFTKHIPIDCPNEHVHRRECSSIVANGYCRSHSVVAAGCISAERPCSRVSARLLIDGIAQSGDNQPVEPVHPYIYTYLFLHIAHSVTLRSEIGHLGSKLFSCLVLGQPEMIEFIGTLFELIAKTIATLKGNFCVSRNRLEDRGCRPID